MSQGFVVAVASGLLGAVLTQCLVWIREALITRRSRHYSALRLALMCEHYALDCASDVELRTGHHEEGDSILPSGMKLPALPDFPGDIEFRALPASLVEPVFSLEKKWKKRGQVHLKKRGQVHFNAYRQLFKEVLSDDRLAEIRAYVQQQRALGTPRFQREIEAMIGRCTSVRAAHRPRRNKDAFGTGSDPLRKAAESAL